MANLNPSNIDFLEARSSVNPSHSEAAWNQRKVQVLTGLTVVAVIAAVALAILACPASCGVVGAFVVTHLGSIAALPITYKVMSVVGACALAAGFDLWARTLIPDDKNTENCEGSEESLKCSGVTRCAIADQGFAQFLRYAAQELTKICTVLKCMRKDWERVPEIVAELSDLIMDLDNDVMSRSVLEKSLREKISKKINQAEPMKMTWVLNHFFLASEVQSFLDQIFEVKNRIIVANDDAGASLENILDSENGKKLTEKQKQQLKMALPGVIRENGYAKSFRLRPNTQPNLCRTIAKTTSGQTYIYWNKKSDGLVGKGSYKKAKTIQNLKTGQEYVRTSAIEEPEQLHEVMLIQKLRGRGITGIPNLLSSRVYTSKKGEEKREVILERYKPCPAPQNIERILLNGCENKEECIARIQMIHEGRGKFFQNISEFAREMPPFSKEKLSAKIKFALSVSNTLKQIHDQGYLHGDIKLANIMQTEDGLGVICDFGLACQKDDETRGRLERVSGYYQAPDYHKAVVNSESERRMYWSYEAFTPEAGGSIQKLAEHTNSSIDVYALGVTFLGLFAPELYAYREKADDTVNAIERMVQHMLKPKREGRCTVERVCNVLGDLCSAL